MDIKVYFHGKCIKPDNEVIKAGTVIFLGSKHLPETVISA